MFKKRLLGPIVAALVGLAALVVPAFADPVQFCSYVFADSTHTSITLPASSPETQCTGGAFGGSGYQNIRVVATVACASTLNDSETLWVNFNGDSGSGAYQWANFEVNHTGSSSGGGASTDTKLVLGRMPCRKASGLNHGSMGINVEIPDFITTAYDKEVVGNYSYQAYSFGNEYQLTGMVGGTWTHVSGGPAAITSITLQPSSSTFTQYSRIVVYLE